MSKTAPATAFATAADTQEFGEYTISGPPPLYRFDGPLTPETATPGRFHVYAGWFCPWAQRVTLVLEFGGLLPEAVTASYVHGERDGRSWAFREPTGADPINGFTLLRDAYEATEPGFDGHISVPTLWDKQTGRVYSNATARLDADLATAFGVTSLYPTDLRVKIDELDSWIRPEINEGKDFATGLDRVEEILQHQDYLLGADLTLADTRLWVTLVRANGSQWEEVRRHPAAAAYVARLAALPQFEATTQYAAFGKERADVAAAIA